MLYNIENINNEILININDKMYDEDNRPIEKIIIRLEDKNIINMDIYTDIFKHTYLSITIYKLISILKKYFIKEDREYILLHVL